MADAVAAGDGAEEIAEGAEQAAALEQTEIDESVEIVDAGDSGESEDVAAAGEADEQSAGAEGVAEPEPGPGNESDAASEPEVELVEVVESETELVVEVDSETELVEVVESETELVEVVDSETEVVEVVESETELVEEVEPETELVEETELVVAELEVEAEVEPEPVAGSETETEAVVEVALEAAPEPEAAASSATLAVAAAAASFVPPQPSQPSAERPVVTLAGRRIDRRAALIAGGVGVIVIGGAVAALASSGGSSGPVNASGGGHGGGSGATGNASTAPSVPLPTITTTPADGASGVDPSKPITVKVLDGTIDSVQLSGHDQTNGTLSTDGSTWTSDNALNVNSSYQLSITAKNTAGKTKSTTVSFHTLKPSAAFGVSSVVPPQGSTVGVGQPIRVTFSNYVPAEYKAALEKACVVRTTPAVAGAWYWVSNSSDGAILDWRPQDFWPVDTKVSVDFNLNGVRLGEHQFGVKNYAPHNFSIRDTDLRLIVDKDKYSATCYRNGKAIRTFPIDTGVTSAETFVTYTGTMAVLGKGNPVEMKGNYGPSDTYDDFVNWATQITWSGTYVHAAPWDPEIGHANDDSHGCVHCRTTDAEWFYNTVHTGDVVTIKGKRKREVAVSNGICTFTLDWASLLKGSAYGATINGKPVSG